MGLVDDDRERAVTLFGADFVEDIRELLDGGDDDLLALLTPKWVEVWSKLLRVMPPDGT
jgi:hypothetical protein